jgi:4-hydroxybenzoate polyprenyltransferase
MSLKVFHLLFIIVAILLAIGCALWAFLNETAFLFGVGSSVTAVALLIYGVWFLKKSRKIIT